MQIIRKRYIKLLPAFLLILIVYVCNISFINSKILDDNIVAVDNISENKKIAKSTEITYTVRNGDSINRIASKYKIHNYQLTQWNNLNIYSVLRPGQELIIKQINYPAYDGMASWYGPGFHGQNMANGQVYDMNDIVVAHRTLPLGRRVKITNLDNGKSIIAPVLDRGPYVKNSKGEYTREIDLSYGVALELGTIKKGVVPVKIEPIDEPLVPLLSLR